MMEIISLTSRIQQLPPELISLTQAAGKIAASQGQNLYLVGGIVRDLLLERTNLDLDLVLEGNAIDLAQRLNRLQGGNLTTYPHFHTAKIHWDRWSVDLATARSETYARPGALPTVKPGSLSNDLSRRDFTINTMAVCLNPDCYGELLDPYHGRDDLENRLIRILHDRSFTDDATRILRALRYQQRLEFRLERNTRQLLKRDIPMLDTISSDRIRHELELILQEEYPERILRRAYELGVLQRLHPSLKADGWLARKFRQGRRRFQPDSPPLGLYLALLAYPLTGTGNEQLVSRLRLPGSLSRIIRDTISIKARLQSLDNPRLTRSGIYRILDGYSTLAIMANLLAGTSPVARRRIQLFLDTLRYVRPALTGTDLKVMGIPPGVRIKEILQLLHEARLDGKVTSRRGEEGLVREAVSRQS